MVAYSGEGMLIGGCRIHVRAGGYGLPIEDDSSPVPLRVRERLRRQHGLCEIRGLWTASEYAGRLLSRRIVEAAIAACREQGFSSIVSLAHWRSFHYVAAPLGFEIDPQMVPMHYPDERFLSVLIRHPLARRPAALENVVAEVCL